MLLRTPCGVSLFVVLASALCAFLAPPASAATGVAVASLPRAAQARDLITGPDGAIWFNGTYAEGRAGEARGFVGRIGPGGAVKRIPLSRGREARAPVVGPGGDIWVPSGNWYGETGYGIARVSMAGKLREYDLQSSGTVWIESIAALGDDIWAGVVLADEHGIIGRPFIERIATSPEVSVEQQFPLRSNCKPTALAAGTDAVWFAELCEGTNPARSTWHSSIARIGPEGETARYKLRPQSNVESLTVAPDGTVWFGSLTDGRGEFGRITPSGELVGYRVRDGDPAMITLAPDGRLWFRSSFGGSVYRALRSIGPGGRLGKLFCTGPKCGLEADGLLATPDGNLWFSATEAHPPPGGGGGSVIAENLWREEEAGVLGRLRLGR